MLDNISLVATQVLVLFILIAVGFVCNKIKLLGGITVKQMTDFVLYIVTPCVIVNSFRREYDPSMLKGLLITFAASFASFAINIALSLLLVQDKNEQRKRVLRYGAVFSNAGFMALPLQQAILGDIGVFYGATYVAVFNIVNWTYGILLMSGDKKYISPKKAILNPGIIGTVVGVALFLLPFDLPDVIGNPVGFLAALNTPVPMIIIGYHLANSKFNIKGFSAYFAMFFRLVLSPLIIFLGLYICGVEGTILVAVTTAVAAPFAATGTMFSEKFGGDTELSAAMVSLTTLLSILTMPVIIALALLVK